MAHLRVNAAVPAHAQAAASSICAAAVTTTPSFDLCGLGDDAADAADVRTRRPACISA